MKISARNVFKGTVSAVKEGPVSAEVDITLPGGDTLVAVITEQSLESLGLVKGKEIVALVKAPLVMLMTDGSGYRLSARNTLQGTVKTLEQGMINTEVVMTLPGGTDLYAIVTKEAAASLDLKVGSPVTAIIKASHIIVGVPA